MLKDRHDRVVNYLRLAVTDKCNLRCTYCMPEVGNNWLSRNELLSYTELIRISKLLVTSGINKIRITGGEPFVRKDILTLLTDLIQLQGLGELSITTNGVLTAPFVPALKKLGVASVNLSLDTLERARFAEITRRDELPAVLATLEQLIKHEIDVKLNVVVMDGKNIEDILPMAALTKDLPLSVRFIEEMPFNGSGEFNSAIKWDHEAILTLLKNRYPNLRLANNSFSSTSVNYMVPGHKGTLGIIAAYSRSFCGTCNRLRLTADGIMKTCLYEAGGLNIRNLLRSDCSDSEVENKIKASLNGKSRDGWEAEKKGLGILPFHNSMATIGG